MHEELRGKVMRPLINGCETMYKDDHTLVRDAVITVCVASNDQEEIEILHGIDIIVQECMTETHPIYANIKGLDGN